MIWCKIYLLNILIFLSSLNDDLYRKCTPVHIPLLFSIHFLIAWLSNETLHSPRILSLTLLFTHSHSISLSISYSSHDGPRAQSGYYGLTFNDIICCATTTTTMAGCGTRWARQRLWEWEVEREREWERERERKMRKSGRGVNRMKCVARVFSRLIFFVVVLVVVTVGAANNHSNAVIEKKSEKKNIPNVVFKGARWNRN